MELTNQMERFRIMFVVRLSNLKDLVVVGTDFLHNCLWTAQLSSPNDSVDLTCTSRHYPEELLSYLRKEKQRIDKGYYSLRTWEMTLYDQTIREVHPEDIKVIKDSGRFHWKSLVTPEHLALLEKAEEKDDGALSLQENEIKRMNEALVNSLHTKSKVNVRIYQEGFVREIEEGVIVKMDPKDRIVGVCNRYGNVHYVPLDCIVGVSTAI